MADDGGAPKQGEHSSDGPGPLRTRRVLGETWEIYRRELLVAIPAALLARVTVVLAATLLVEIPVTVLHLFSNDEVLQLTDDSVDVYFAALLSVTWANLGHHLLSGVLERVVAAERHGHANPTLRETLQGLPWGRLVVADIALTLIVVLALAMAVVPGVVIVAILICVMPLLSMRHENLRTVWGASVRLVRGSFWPVLGAVLVGWFAQTLIVTAAAQGIYAITHDHTLEVLAHGVAALVVVPFAALVPVVLTFDLLELRRIAPTERY